MNLNTNLPGPFFITIGTRDMNGCLYLVFVFPLQVAVWAIVATLWVYWWVCFKSFYLLYRSMASRMGRRPPYVQRGWW